MSALDWSPAHYRIRIRGHHDPAWSTWFDGLAISQEEDGKTTLAGALVDQAALYGLLSRLRDLGATLLAVERLEAELLEHEDAACRCCGKCHRAGRQALGLAQLRKAPPRLQEGLLHHVFGGVRSDPVQLCQPQQARCSPPSSCRIRLMACSSSKHCAPSSASHLPTVSSASKRRILW
jgi:hypothetical protein